MVKKFLGRTVEKYYLENLEVGTRIPVEVINLEDENEKITVVAVVEDLYKEDTELQVAWRLETPFDNDKVYAEIEQDKYNRVEVYVEVYD